MCILPISIKILKSFSLGIILINLKPRCSFMAISLSFSLCLSLCVYFYQILSLIYAPESIDQIYMHSKHNASVMIFC